jgi:diacylglycerol kinase family enzyme
VVAAGGDGTASTICYALRNTALPILVYPAGTANLLALNLNMPTEPRALADVALMGQQVRFDLGELSRPVGPGGSIVRSGFAIMAGAGYDASIMEAAQQFKSTLGAFAYLMGAVANLAPTTSQFELELDGEHVTTDGIAVLIVNFGRIQFDLPVANGADPRDGLFQVAVLRTRNVAGLLPAIVAVLSGAEKAPGIDVYQASRVKVEAEPQLRMQSDGDVFEDYTPFEAAILPRATSLLLPSDSPYAE